MVGVRQGLAVEEDGGLRGIAAAHAHLGLEVVLGGDPGRPRQGPERISERRGPKLEGVASEDSPRQPGTCLDRGTRHRDPLRQECTQVGIDPDLRPGVDPDSLDDPSRVRLPLEAQEVDTGGDIVKSIGARRVRQSRARGLRARSGVRRRGGKAGGQDGGPGSSAFRCERDAHGGDRRVTVPLADPPAEGAARLVGEGASRQRQEQDEEQAGDFLRTDRCPVGLRTSAGTGHTVSLPASAPAPDAGQEPTRI